MKGDIELHFIPTEYQLAGIFTKPLDEPTFTRLKAELGMLDIDNQVTDWDIIHGVYTYPLKINLPQWNLSTSPKSIRRELLTLRLNSLNSLPKTFHTEWILIQGAQDIILMQFNA